MFSIFRYRQKRVRAQEVINRNANFCSLSCECLFAWNNVYDTQSTRFISIKQKLQFRMVSICQSFNFRETHTRIERFPFPFLSLKLWIFEVKSVWLLRIWTGRVLHTNVSFCLLEIFSRLLCIVGLVWLCSMITEHFTENKYCLMESNVGKCYFYCNPKRNKCGEMVKKAGVLSSKPEMVSNNLRNAINTPLVHNATNYCSFGTKKKKQFQFSVSMKVRHAVCRMPSLHSSIFHVRFFLSFPSMSSFPFKTMSCNARATQWNQHTSGGWHRFFFHWCSCCTRP